MTTKDQWLESVRCMKGHSQYVLVRKGPNNIHCAQCAQLNAREAAALRSWNSFNPTYFTHVAYVNPQENSQK